MRSAPSLFVVCMLVGCTPRGSAPTTAPDPVEPSASASSQSPLDVSSDAEPEPSPADASVTAGASESGLWFEPLPALTLASLSDEQKVRSQECGKTHRVSEPDVTVVELMAAAECFADIPVPGRP